LNNVTAQSWNCIISTNVIYYTEILSTQY